MDNYFTTFNVSAGATVNVTGASLTVHASGDCTINGTIRCGWSARHPLRASTGNALALGGPSGGSGGGTAGGAQGKDALYWVTYPYTTYGSGAAGAASGGAGGASNDIWGANGSLYMRTYLSTGFGGDGVYAGGGAGQQGGSSGGAGGNPGGGVLIICGSITGTGTINTNGSNGGNSVGNNTGAGSGGGGGPIIISSQAAETFGLTLNAAAGTAGSAWLLPAAVWVARPRREKL